MVRKVRSNKQAYLLAKVSIRSTAKPHIACLHLCTLRVLAAASLPVKTCHSGLPLLAWLR